MKRRDFLKGVGGLFGGLFLFGKGKAKAGAAIDMAELRKQNPRYLISCGNDPVLEIIVKKTFSKEAGPLEISLRNEEGKFLFFSRLISPLEMTKGKVLRFPLQPLPSKGPMHVVFGYYGRVPSDGLLETNIIYS